MFLFNYKHQTKVVNTCMMFCKQIYLDYGLYFDAHFPNIPIDWAFFLRFVYFSKIYGLNDILVRMNRVPDRESVTKNKKHQFQAVYELLHVFKYEKPMWVTKPVYQFALVTQKLLELGQYRYLGRMVRLLWYVMLYPKDYRVHAKIREHVGRLFRS